MSIRRVSERSGGVKSRFCRPLSYGRSGTKIVSIIDPDEEGHGYLKDYLSDGLGFRRGEWHTRADVGLRAIATSGTEVALVSVGFPQRSWVECVRKLKEHLPGATVVVLGENATTSFIQSLHAGADGYFVLPGSAQAFRTTVGDAVQGWKPFPREIQKLVAELLCRTSFRSCVGGDLTPAEQEVLSYFCLGMCDKEIAAARGTSQGTVHCISNSIFKKLGVHKRRDAVRIYLAGGSPSRSENIWGKGPSSDVGRPRRRLAEVSFCSQLPGGA